MTSARGRSARAGCSAKCSLQRAVVVANAHVYSPSAVWHVCCREAKRAENARNRALLKAEEVQAKAVAAQAKEDERMAAFRALVEKGPITIAKRQ